MYKKKKILSEENLREEGFKREILTFILEDFNFIILLIKTNI